MKSVCFISTTGRHESPVIDPSTRYRCHHPASVLREGGWRCSVTSTARFFGHDYEGFDAYVFHRPLFGEQMILFMEWARSAGRVVIADYDDLIFGDEDMALQASTFKNGVMGREEVIDAFQSNLSAMRLFSRVTVSTAPLQAIVRSLNPGAEVIVVPNRISRSYADASMMFPCKPFDRNHVSLMYASGTKSHDLDFRVAEEALLEVLAQPHVSRLDLVGPLAVSESVATHPKVNRIKHTDIFRLPRVKSRADILIAPLELSVFNRCKSGIKFLESAIQGIPLVCTPIPDIEIHNGHYTPARATEEWASALMSAIHQPRDAGELQRYVVNHWICSDHLGFYQNAIFE